MPSGCRSNCLCTQKSQHLHASALSSSVPRANSSACPHVHWEQGCFWVSSSAPFDHKAAAFPCKAEALFLRYVESSDVIKEPRAETGWLQFWFLIYLCSSVASEVLMKVR